MKNSHDQRDNQVLLVNRIAHALLAIVVLPFAIGLTFYAEHTDKNFAWHLQPNMSVMIQGALYISVVYTFTHLALARYWHRVAMIMWATLPVLSLLGAITLVHWSKFKGPLPVLIIWVGVYVFLPPVLALLLYLNHRRDPGTPEPVDVVIPLSVRVFTLALAVLYGAVGAALLLVPDRLIEVWPWPMKPLAAQALGCLFLAPTAVHAIAVFESRWSAMRVVTQGAMVWFFGILVATIRCWNEFDQSRPLTWVFVVVLAAEIAFVIWSYVSLEAMRKRQIA